MSVRFGLKDISSENDESKSSPMLSPPPPAPPRSLFLNKRIWIEFVIIFAHLITVEMRQLYYEVFCLALRRIHSIPPTLHL